MMPVKVLFVCIHNSARSQMAEAFLNAMGGEHFVAESAGLDPGKLNSDVVRVMKELDIDIALNKTKSVKSMMERRYDYVVTVCDEASGERCPTFPGKTRRLHWSFADPSSFEGKKEEIYARTVEVRDAIQKRVGEFMNSFFEYPHFP